MFSRAPRTHRRAGASSTNAFVSNSDDETGGTSASQDRSLSGALGRGSSRGRGRGRAAPVAASRLQVGNVVSTAEIDVLFGFGSAAGRSSRGRGAPAARVGGGGATAAAASVSPAAVEPSNQDIVDMLHDLAQQASERGTKNMYSYRKATTSVCRYPLPIRSGNEAMLLEHIGATIARQISSFIAARPRASAVPLVRGSSAAAAAASSGFPTPASLQGAAVRPSLPTMFQSLSSSAVSSRPVAAPPPIKRVQLQLPPPANPPGQESAVSISPSSRRLLKGPETLPPSYLTMLSNMNKSASAAAAPPPLASPPVLLQAASALSIASTSTNNSSTATASRAATADPSPGDLEDLFAPTPRLSQKRSLSEASESSTRFSFVSAEFELASSREQAGVLVHESAVWVLIGHPAEDTNRLHVKFGTMLPHSAPAPAHLAARGVRFHYVPEASFDISGEGEAEWHNAASLWHEARNPPNKPTTISSSSTSSSFSSSSAGPAPHLASKEPLQPSLAVTKEAPLLRSQSSSSASVRFGRHDLFRSVSDTSNASNAMFVPSAEQTLRVPIVDAAQIQLVVDAREMFSSNGEISPVYELLAQLDGPPITRPLPVGDFVWIATVNGKEYLLDYICERKRMDDLEHSILDRRFREQKFRLLSCGVSNVVYIVEELMNFEAQALSASALRQAMANTQVHCGFKLQLSKTPLATVNFLRRMTAYLQQRYLNKDLCVLRPGALQALAALTPESQRNSSARTLPLLPPEYHLSYEDFTAQSEKNGQRTLKDLTAAQLLQIKGLTSEKLKEIINVYGCLRQLHDAFQSDSVGTLQRLADIKFGRVVQCKPLGMPLAKAIATAIAPQLFPS
ncbi:hypothetical protein CAOG_009600 [Capsaspora owczarzaki ATCC 30864]|uniref:Crossover junction endonuclease MUS81 n=1 Tax=Capsaspora owczarzaki (strain ATCC 30864) TaxID=595528 RepID=A0A0D2X235_CAPO3|nr:hypothetical protein CAOG_009600 [Capsaspora owczarzaki ATCC 30864]